MVVIGSATLYKVNTGAAQYKSNKKNDSLEISALVKG
jgi:hypothetical protein